MQLRARLESEAKAVRTVSRAQILVLAAALVPGAAALAAGPLGEAAFHASWGLPLLVAGAAWMALGPVAVWLAVADD